VRLLSSGYYQFTHAKEHDPYLNYLFLSKDKLLQGE